METRNTVSLTSPHGFGFPAAWPELPKTATQPYFIPRKHGKCRPLEKRKSVKRLLEDYTLLNQQQGVFLWVPTSFISITFERVFQNAPALG